MLLEDCFELGKLTKLHGYKGDIVLHFFSSTPEDYKDLESVLLEYNQELVPFFFEHKSKLKGSKMIVRFEDISPADSKKLVGAHVYIPLAMLPEIEQEDSFYYHEVKGYSAHQKDGSVLGIIEDVLDNTAQDLFLIVKDSRELLVPVVDDFIVEVNKVEKKIYLDLPEGFIDLYQ